MTLIELLEATGTAPQHAIVITLVVCFACGWTFTAERPASTLLMRCPICWHWRVI